MVLKEQRQYSALQFGVAPLLHITILCTLGGEADRKFAAMEERERRAVKWKNDNSNMPLTFPQTLAN